jgi:hypothetical protein
MKELIQKNPDGIFEYDRHKFFTFDEALLAEWQLNSPELDKAVLSQLLERFVDKTRYCTDGRGRFKPEKWDRLVEAKAKQLTSVQEKCYCEQLLEQYRADAEDKEINIAGDSTFGPAINMAITEDPWTKKRLFYYLRAYEEGDNSTDYLRYCPFCGKKLTEITK